jgi:hypothetical protein
MAGTWRVAAARSLDAFGLAMKGVGVRIFTNIGQSLFLSNKLLPVGKLSSTRTSRRLLVL